VLVVAGVQLFQRPVLDLFDRGVRVGDAANRARRLPDRFQLIDQLSYQCASLPTARTSCEQKVVLTIDRLPLLGGERL